ncbi:DNA topoisomerase IB [Fulvimarina sp. 2208YS6-2-32]|uniref:DNA topoisomerase n=1 Tax=Fulvimarina uroteuthidis TaxID=3098149 RepID=A0ABU5I275_9HYPH|nr:DNA topoisomerase IB [Fulvimarina sp. 2208YS6-2-32]MDY8109331.1 DNA topoisomerase IB [Fulvimarina sp. 2208YS6-2-32]
MNPRLAHHAEIVGLSIVDPETFEIERQTLDDGHRVCFRSGEAVNDERLRKRIDELVIPPAWTDVRICIEGSGHIQAIGRDEKGRLQYRYHDRWVDVRNAVKAERLMRFGKALPKLRKAVSKDMRRRQRDRKFAAATATRLVDLAAMRAGHEKYAADGGRGVSSLTRKNLRIRETRVAVLKFTGKSNRKHEIEIRDRKLVENLAAVRKVEGSRLFKFAGDQRKSRKMTAGVLNTYMRDASGKRISAKDFRTFHGSVEALRFLCLDEKALTAETEAKKKKAVAAAMRSVSERLRNTPAVARSSYVHPGIITAFEAGELSPDLMKGRTRAGLNQEETGLMRFLEGATPE